MQNRDRHGLVHMKHYICLAWVLGAVVTCTPLRGLGATGEPQKPIEFVTPAGPGEELT
jgi:hypothetical protein